MNAYLLIDFGSTYTKLTAVDIDSKKLLGTSSHFTTVSSDIRIGYHHALEQLQKKMGTITFSKIIACSSAAGGLKMAAVGLVEELTVEAAKRACYGAGGKVDLVFSHFLTSKEVALIKDKKIDIILLAGGTDGGNSEVVIHNARLLASSNLNIPIIYAGNKSCQDEIQDIFQKNHVNGFICDNIMPKLNVLNIEKAKEVIRTIFLENIIVAKGIKQIESEIDAVMLPTPFAVLKAAELLSKGYLYEAGLGDLVISDVGGATTDIYSMGFGYPKKADVVLKGLQEPYAKRTVEGDLGMRYSAMGVIETLSEQEIALFNDKGIDLKREALYRHDHVEMVSKTKEEEAIDRLFGGICHDIAISRHVGKMELAYTPMGLLYYQTGKDLTEVSYVIGTGGIVIHDSNPVEILTKLCFDNQKPLELRPIKPQFMIDRHYILSAMGLLSIDHPEIALKIMKGNLEKI
ncbi:MAG: methylaspartate mutase accessory protein GlmL [Bacilli bacterium]